jgi:hypothetical protein
LRVVMVKTCVGVATPAGGILSSIMLWRDEARNLLRGPAL